MGAFRIGRIAGIDILVHYSWFFIFFLLTWWLSEGFYQEVYDDWSAGEAWAVAVVTTLLFFSSVLLHELSHSIVARRLGLPVRNITLFIFGGVSALGEEPSSAKQEFKVAIAGPLTSFALAGAAAAVAVVAYVAGQENKPLGAVAEYLAIINISVGVFNLLPGFPLDGGRVLRAGLWARSGNMLTATRWASGSGTVISVGLMVVGVVSILFGSFINGAWFFVIGWFLRNASESSYQQLLYKTTLAGTKVGPIVNRNFKAAPPDATLSELVSSYILAQGQRCVPILAGEELLGLVSMSDLQRVAHEQWDTVSAFRAMTPREKLHTTSPDDDLTRALEIMATHDVHQLPVLDGRLFLGFITRADVMHFMQIRKDLSEARA